MAKPKNNQFLEQLEDGRYRIRENLSISGKGLKKLPITESNRTIQIEGKELKCRGAYSGVEVSRPNKENLNERIYSDRLWENVITNQKDIWDGGLGLANHPKSEADVTNTCIVWHNLKFNEDKSLVIADMYCVGEYGQLITEILDAGGKVGLSTSGFGDFEDDGKTIQENYVLERVADFVDAPSYEVYARKDNEMEYTEKNSKKEMKLFSEIDTNNINTDKEKIQMNEALKNSMNKIEEKNFKLSINRLIAEADSKENLKEKFDAYKEVLSYFDGVDIAVDIKENVKEKLNSLNEEILTFAEKGKELDSLVEKNTSIETEKIEISEKYLALEKENTTLKEKYELASEMLDELKDYVEKLKDMYQISVAEKNGMIEAFEYVELKKYTDKLDSKIQKLNSAFEESKKVKTEKIETSKKVESKKVEPKKKIEVKKIIEEVEEKEVPKKESKISDIFRNDDEVLAYYNDLLKENANVEKIKDLILNSKTLFEAQKVWLNNQDDIDSIPSPYAIRHSDEINTIKKQREDNSSFIERSLKEKQGWQ